MNSSWERCSDAFFCCTDIFQQVFAGREMKLKKHWDLVTLIFCWTVFLLVALCIDESFQLTDFGISILHGPIGVRSLCGAKVLGEELPSRITIALLGLFIASLVGAVIFRVAVKWQASMKVSFRKALGTVFTAYLIILSIEALLLLSPEYGSPWMRIILTAVGFLVYALVISWRLPVNLKRALLITLAVVAVGVAIAIAGGLVVLIIVLPLKSFIS